MIARGGQRPARGSVHENRAAPAGLSTIRPRLSPRPAQEGRRRRRDVAARGAGGTDPGSGEPAREAADRAGGDARAGVEDEGRRAAVRAAVEARVADLAPSLAARIGGPPGEREWRGEPPRRESSWTSCPGETFPGRSAEWCGPGPCGCGRPANAGAGKTGWRRGAGSGALDARTLRRHRLNENKDGADHPACQTPSLLAALRRAAGPSPRSRGVGPRAGHLLRSAAVTEADSSMPPSEDRPGLARGRYVPAVLTALVPGLGHLVAGRTRLAAIFGLPLVLLAGLGPACSSRPRRTSSWGSLLDDRVLVLLLVLQAALLGWRLLALGSSLDRPTAARAAACAMRCRSSPSSSSWPPRRPTPAS